MNLVGQSAMLLGRILALGARSQKPEARIVREQLL
jgi:hypothetical protein